VECSLSPLTIWLRWEQAGSGGSGFAGRGESSFAGSGGLGFAGRGGSGFAGSKLVAVDWASLVGGYYMISWKNNRRVKYPMLVIVMVEMVTVAMVMVVMVMVVMVMVVMVMVMVVTVMVVMVMAVMVMVVVEMTIEKRGLMECMQYEKFASFCNLILPTVRRA
jgi:hypothetical protein